MHGGETHTAEIAINEVRKRFRSYDSVAAMAFAGAATRDIVFRARDRVAAEDLAGGRLEALAEMMDDVQLLVIDELLVKGDRHFTGKASRADGCAQGSGIDRNAIVFSQGAGMCASENVHACAHASS